MGEDMVRHKRKKIDGELESDLRADEENIKKSVTESFAAELPVC
jgi:hypothetical protein